MKQIKNLLKQTMWLWITATLTGSLIAVIFQKDIVAIFFLSVGLAFSSLPTVLLIKELFGNLKKWGKKQRKKNQIYFTNYFGERIYYTKALEEAIRITGEKAQRRYKIKCFFVDCLGDKKIQITLKLICLVIIVYCLLFSLENIILKTAMTKSLTCLFAALFLAGFYANLVQKLERIALFSVALLGILTYTSVYILLSISRNHLFPNPLLILFIEFGCLIAYVAGILISVLFQGKFIQIKKDVEKMRTIERREKEWEEKQKEKEVKRRVKNRKKQL